MIKRKIKAELKNKFIRLGKYGSYGYTKRNWILVDIKPEELRDKFGKNNVLETLFNLKRTGKARVEEIEVLTEK